MAGQTYAYNLLNEDLEECFRESTIPKHVKWISSSYPVTEVKQRLSENPSKMPPIGDGYSELSDKLSDYDGTLLIGNIVSFNNYLRDHKDLVDELRNENLDLVSGGPPCQSFSLAGLRQLDNERNRLPMEFAEFVDLSRPRVALLENVTGILRGFTIPGNDEKHYAWFEVARAFAQKNYYPICLHINAKYVGVAQNRPRFIMLAFRSDVFEELRLGVSESALISALEKSAYLVQEEISGRGFLVSPETDYRYYDIEKDKKLFECSFFKRLNINSQDNWHTCYDALHDLTSQNGKGNSSLYINNIETVFGSLAPDSFNSQKVLNSTSPRHGLRVKQRFNLYQLLSCAPANVDDDVRKFLRGAVGSISPEVVEYFSEKKLLKTEKSWFVLNTKRKLENYFKKLLTKKHSQQALTINKPAPATLSIPDDVCHYSELRTLSVREVARLQSFPDWFEFKSKATTGDLSRRFEVPQYTQVGNAVPPLLGYTLGSLIKELLSKLDDSRADQNIFSVENDKFVSCN